jgi:trans-aconitate 2-methyltransferase
MSDAWDPCQYERFREERWEPFVDLVALVEPKPGLRVVDLGCGTGETTRWLHDTLGAGETLGIDRSPAMLARARSAVVPGLRFEPGTIEEFRARDAWDVVFSNAALHWVPDHPALFARLAAALRDGGQLAVQMPASFDGPSHVTAAEVATEAPFREHLDGAPRGTPLLAPEAYAALLAALGFRAQHVRVQVYGHWLAERGEVVEWAKGTLLTAYRARLSPALYEEFVARYRARLLPRLVDTRPFFFPFKRLLLWARR